MKSNKCDNKTTNKTARKSYIELIKNEDYFDPEVFNENVSLDKMHTISKAYRYGIDPSQFINCEDDPIKILHLYQKLSGVEDSDKLKYNYEELFIGIVMNAVNDYKRWKEYLKNNNYDPANPKHYELQLYNAYLSAKTFLSGKVVGDIVFNMYQ